MNKPCSSAISQPGVRASWLAGPLLLLEKIIIANLNTLSEMKLDSFENRIPRAVDDSLTNWEKLSQKKQAIIDEENKIINDIQNGFQEVVVMFIDMVDSTKFKTANKSRPEFWITRVRQFSQIVEAYVNDCGGRVVKDIGDELLVVFNRADKVNDAINLLNRMDTMQQALSAITKSETKVKIALDLGDVFFLQYEGHQEPDPQGTAVDRCARIAKYCQPGTALTSYDFIHRQGRPTMWQQVGEAELKGIGRTKIFQFGDLTVEMKDMVEVEVGPYNELRTQLASAESQVEDLSLRLSGALNTNGELASQLKEAGQRVAAELVLARADNECEASWQEVEAEVRRLQKCITDSPVGNQEYARFLFLQRRDKSWQYNRYTGDTFVSSIEHNMVVKDSGNESYYRLNPEHKRNQQVITVMDNAEIIIRHYAAQCGEREEDLFTYSLADAEFWQKYVGYLVSR